MFPRYQTSKARLLLVVAAWTCNALVATVSGAGVMINDPTVVSDHHHLDHEESRLFDGASSSSPFATDNEPTSSSEVQLAHLDTASTRQRPPLLHRTTPYVVLDIDDSMNDRGTDTSAGRGDVYTHEHELALALMSGLDAKSGVALERAWKCFREVSGCPPNSQPHTHASTNGDGSYLEQQLHMVREQLQSNPWVRREIVKTLRALEKKTGQRAAHDLQSIFDQASVLARTVASMERDLFSKHKDTVHYVSTAAPHATKDLPPIGNDLVVMTASVLRKVRATLQRVPFSVLAKVRREPAARDALARKVTRAIYGSLPIETRVQRIAALCKVLHWKHLLHDSVHRNLCGSYVQWEQSPEPSDTATGDADVDRVLSPLLREHQIDCPSCPRLFHSVDETLHRLQEIPTTGQLMMHAGLYMVVALVVAIFALTPAFAMAFFMFSFLEISPFFMATGLPVFAGVFLLMHAYLCWATQWQMMEEHFAWPPQLTAVHQEVQNDDDIL